MRGRWERGTQSGPRLLSKPPAQWEPRCNGKRPASDEIAGAGECGKRDDAAAVQQLRRRRDEALKLAIRAHRSVEVCEAAKPLRELNPMGKGIRNAVVFLVVTS